MHTLESWYNMTTMSMYEFQLRVKYTVQGILCIGDIVHWVLWFPQQQALSTLHCYNHTNAMDDLKGNTCGY